MRRGALEIVATHLKFDACEAARVALKSPQTLPSGDVPHHQLAVTAGTDDTVPLQTNGVDRALVAVKRAMHLQCVALPHSNQSVLRANRDFSEQRGDKSTTAYQLTIHLGLISMSNTPPPWPLRTPRNSAVTAVSMRPGSSSFEQVYMSHTQTVWSLDPLTMNPLRQSDRPSSASAFLGSRSQSFSNFRQSTLPRCPLIVARHRPVFKLQTLIDRSLEPVITRAESNSAQYTL